MHRHLRQRPPQGPPRLRARVGPGSNGPGSTPCAAGLRGDRRRPERARPRASRGAPARTARRRLGAAAHQRPTARRRPALSRAASDRAASAPARRSAVAIHTACGQAMGYTPAYRVSRLMRRGFPKIGYFLSNAVRARADAWRPPASTLRPCFLPGFCAVASTRLRTAIHTACGQALGYTHAYRVSRLVRRGSSEFGDILSNAVCACADDSRRCASTLRPCFSPDFLARAAARTRTAIHIACGQACGQLPWNRVPRLARQGLREFGYFLSRPSRRGKRSPRREASRCFAAESLATAACVRSRCPHSLWTSMRIHAGESGSTPCTTGLARDWLFFVQCRESSGSCASTRIVEAARRYPHRLWTSMRTAALESGFTPAMPRL